MTKIFELYELLPPFFCLEGTLNVWVLETVNEFGIAQLRNAENDEVFWAPEARLAPLQIR